MRFWKYTAVVLLGLMTGGSALQAMPPHPDLLEKFRKEGRLDSLSKRVSAVQSKSGMNAGKASSISSGVVKIPVILVQYTNRSFNGVSNTAFYSDRLNGSGAITLSVKKYFSDMSNGRLNLQFDVYGPYTASNTLEHYGTNAGGDDQYPGKLVHEAVDALINEKDPEVNFSIYDNDKNGYIDTVIIIHCGPGEEVSGNSTDIWSHQWDLASAKNSGDGEGPVTADGVTFNVYTIQPEYNTTAGDTTVGVFCHEFGHVLGLPDLYDTSYATNGVGDWSLMGSGSWGGTPKGSRPAPLLAWERYKTGGAAWINLTEVNPAGFINGNDRGVGYFVLVILAVLVSWSLFSLRFSPLVRGAVVSVCGVMLVSFISCGSETTSVTRINGTINDIETSYHAFRIGLNDPYSAQYLFLEGKKESAAGWHVPGTGILATHIHEGIIGAYSYSNSVNAGISRVHGVNIVEASTSAEPGKLWTVSIYKGAAGDLFCQENNSSLTDATVPGSRYYTGSGVNSKTGDSGVTIEKISSKASFPMTFTATIE